MQGVIEGYQNLLAQATEVIQVTPNLLESARRFLRPDPMPYPVVCDPDKRLYAVYGLGDRGVLAATRAGVVSFAVSFTTGDTGSQLRGASHDVVNRNFLPRRPNLGGEHGGSGQHLRVHSPSRQLISRRRPGGVFFAEGAARPRRRFHDHHEGGAR
jgi:hypothetical protein